MTAGGRGAEWFDDATDRAVTDGTVPGLEPVHRTGRAGRPDRRIGLTALAMSLAVLMSACTNTMVNAAGSGGLPDTHPEKPVVPPNEIRRNAEVITAYLGESPVPAAERQPLRAHP